jgi:hypothetical protein
MTFSINPKVRARFPEGFWDQLLNLEDGLGYEIFNEILNKKGAHISNVANSRGGKTERKKLFLLWLSRMGETLIEFDTGKPGDTEPFFWNDNPAARYNKPVNVLIPYEGGCRFDITGVPEEIPVSVIPVPAPSLYWDYVVPGGINIISLRNYFSDVKTLKRYLREMFKDFALNARKGKYRKWGPTVLSIDEAHEAAGSQKVSKDQDSILLSLDLTNMERQLASSGIRMFLTTQGFYDLPEGIRQNSHIFIIGRGTSCEKRDHKKIHWLEGFAERARPNEAWLVIHGDHYYKRSPIPWPLVGVPEGVRIDYTRGGMVDAPMEGEEERELITDGGWRAASHIMPDPADLIRGPSISEIPDIPVEEEGEPVRFVNVWEQREKQETEKCT